MKEISVSVTLTELIRLPFDFDKSRRVEFSILQNCVMDVNQEIKNHANEGKESE